MASTWRQWRPSTRLYALILLVAVLVTASQLASGAPDAVAGFAGFMVLVTLVWVGYRAVTVHKNAG